MTQAEHPGTPVPSAAAPDDLAVAKRIAWARHKAIMGERGDSNAEVYWKFLAENCPREVEAFLAAARAAHVPTDDMPAFTAATRDVIADIAAERRRQVEVEGWTPEHDDARVNCEMSAAAASYAMFAAEPYYDQLRDTSVPFFWPWDMGLWKPKDRRRDLIRAGALIVAEIERLDRAARGEG